MNAPDLTRLHAARMVNTETGYRMEEMRPRFQALATRHEDGTAPRAVAAFQLFQTPATLAARMVGLADIKAHHSVLEPSAGLGRLLVPILARKPGRVHACELDATLAGELFTQFPGVELSQGDFLEKHLGEFDRIVMNPPFHMRADVRHVLHAMGHLAPGGVLVGLCLAGRHREEGIRPLCDHWETIPAGAFKAEGTNVETILFRIQN
jgi:protein-L-isoaspartate O-methyltransferase